MKDKRSIWCAGLPTGTGQSGTAVQLQSARVGVKNVGKYVSQLVLRSPGTGVHCSQSNANLLNLIWSRIFETKSC